MTFDTHIHIAQAQGGPNPEGVGRGAKHLFDALNPKLNFKRIETDPSLGETSQNIAHYDAIHDNLQATTSWFAQHQPKSFFTLGGDCSIDVAGIDYLHSLHGDGFGVIWIDAHADINAPEESTSKYFHGMPLRSLLGEGDAALCNMLSAPLTRRQICYAGIQSIDPPEQAYIDQHQLPVLTAADVNERRYDAFENWVEDSGITQLHIHFDLDALAPEGGIDVTYPVGSIRYDAMREFLGFLHGCGITAGFTLTEYAPKSDTPNQEIIDKIKALTSVIVPL